MAPLNMKILDSYLFSFQALAAPTLELSKSCGFEYFNQLAIHPSIHPSIHHLLVAHLPGETTTTTTTTTML
jgi:hypothetical protein